MKRRSFAAWPCSIARTADLIGDAWTVVILRELFYGETRFEGFVQALGIPRNTLTDRLMKLVDAGVVVRETYQADPVRHQYVLTTKGADLLGVVVAINAWGDRWLTDDDGVPVLLHHESCGHDLVAEVVCTTCHLPVERENVTARVGPGYPQRMLGEPLVERRFARAIEDHG